MVSAPVIRFFKLTYGASPAAWLIGWLNNERIHTDFDTETIDHILELLLPSKITFHKILDGGSHHIEILIYGHNLVATA